MSEQRFRLTQIINGAKQVISAKPLNRDTAEYSANVQNRKSPRANFRIESEEALKAQGVTIPRRRK